MNPRSVTPVTEPNVSLNGGFFWVGEGVEDLNFVPCSVRSTTGPFSFGGLELLFVAAQDARVPVLNENGFLSGRETRSTQDGASEVGEFRKDHGACASWTQKVVTVEDAQDGSDEFDGGETGVGTPLFSGGFSGLLGGTASFFGWVENDVVTVGRDGSWVVPSLS